MSDLQQLATQIFHAPETQATITGGAVVAYITNPSNLIFVLTVGLLALQIGLALHKYYVIWKNRKSRGNKN